MKNDKLNKALEGHAPSTLRSYSEKAPLEAMRVHKKVDKMRAENSTTNKLKRKQRQKKQSLLLPPKKV